jgi:hypothetical protein
MILAMRLSPITENDPCNVSESDLSQLQMFCTLADTRACAYCFSSRKKISIYTFVQADFIVGEWMCFMCVFTCTAILIIIEFQVFQRFSSSKLVLKIVESCFLALNYYENGSTMHVRVWHACSGACAYLGLCTHVPAGKETIVLCRTPWGRLACVL